MKIVLHICCGVCAAGVVERLTLEGNEVLGLFYNPNIHPLEEYERRLEATHKVAKELNLWRMRLYVDTSNDVARNFYKKSGYMENGDCKFCEVDVKDIDI